jgi:ABC-type microcin C transport system permease subunit YejB
MSIAEIVAYVIILFLACLIILFASGKFFTWIQ